MRTFEYRDARSHKFWSIDRHGCVITITSGNVGTVGRTKTIKCANESKAQQRYDAIVAKTLANRFIEQPEATPTQAMRCALEQALADDPDDLAAHHAYADFLTDQGDPRGEFIQVQLALEDESRSPAERRRLQARERELLRAHEKEWLGETATLLLGTEAEQRALLANELGQQYRGQAEDGWEVYARHAWRRGWLDRFECTSLGVETTRKFGRFPLARLLRSLIWRRNAVVSWFRYKSGSDVPKGGPNHDVVRILARYPVVRNVRCFQFGEEPDCELDGYAVGTQFLELAPLIEAMPRLEELRLFAHIYPGYQGDNDLGRTFSLPTLANLRTLWYYHGHNYPLEKLAENPVLTRLTHLLCFPHSGARMMTFHGPPDFGIDYGEGVINRANVRALLHSPHLPSLTHLQLRMCDGGDDTIRDVIASGRLNRLKFLDLRHGRVTDEGARLFAACPEARQLESLDLINNRLTAAGIEALTAAGIRVRADRQQEEPYREDAFLWYGDSE